MPSLAASYRVHSQVKGFHSALHTRRGDGFDGACNQKGCVVNFGNDSHTPAGVPTASLYGLHGAAIDTSRPFHVSVTFDEDGVWSTTLSQDGRTVPHFNASAASVSYAVSARVTARSNTSTACSPLLAPCLPLLQPFLPFLALSRGHLTPHCPCAMRDAAEPQRQPSPLPNADGNIARCASPIEPFKFDRSERRRKQWRRRRRRRRRKRRGARPLPLHVGFL